MHALAASICKPGHPHHIPATLYFAWNELPAFKAIPLSPSAQSKSEVVVKCLQNRAAALGMDADFLSENAETVMEHLNWLPDTKSGRETPFTLALKYFECMAENVAKAREKAKQDEIISEKKKRAAQQQADLKEKLASMTKERRICIACNVPFIIMVPAGGFQDPVPEGQLDKNQHCYACFDMKCCLCKGQVCIEADELEYFICHSCPKIECVKCSGMIKHSEGLPHNRCIMCYRDSHCSMCKMFSPTVFLMGTRPLCANCGQCTACNKNFSSDFELESRMCVQCAEASLNDF